MPAKVDAPLALDVANHRPDERIEASRGVRRSRGRSEQDRCSGESGEGRVECGVFWKIM